MILVDTHILLWDSLHPKKLSSKAKKELEKGDFREELYISEWTLWEIALLIKKGRFDPGSSCLEFIQLALDARKYSVIGINAEIANLCTELPDSVGKDPVDRVLLASALYHECVLISADDKIRKSGLGKIVW